MNYSIRVILEFASKIGSCYYWHVFTWFRMECPTCIILCYFIVFHVPDLNDKIGEWHCYSWNVSLKYASCCIHWSEKDLTDDQNCYLRKAFSKHFWSFHRIFAGWELSVILGTSKEGHNLYKYDFEYILNCFGVNASTLRVINSLWIFAQFIYSLLVLGNQTLLSAFPIVLHLITAYYHSVSATKVAEVWNNSLTYGFF